MKKIILSMTLLALSTNTLAAMYKCQQNGNISFQDQPCNKAQQQSNVAIKSAAGGEFNPQEYLQAPTPPSEALYQQLLGSWCEDDERFYVQMSALQSQLDHQARPNYQAMLQQLKQKDPAAYAKIINTPPRLVVTLYANHTAREYAQTPPVGVVQGKEGFQIGNEGLTIYRHGQHFYRGSHEFHRIPLMRCPAQ